MIGSNARPLQAKPAVLQIPAAPPFSSRETPPWGLKPASPRKSPPLQPWLEPATCALVLADLVDGAIPTTPNAPKGRSGDPYRVYPDQYSHGVDNSRHRGDFSAVVSKRREASGGIVIAHKRRGVAYRTSRPSWFSTSPLGLPRGGTRYSWEGTKWRTRI